ncbi:MAG: hypothetical protein Q8S03_10235 [Brevundimonas sp.]|uniref:hypothetical protein n=1 Tax=Brevundimonas sp. TaxID=1871086 RepID=UPI002736E695|nr:hypothetical protein [Brevundimonas sp.]MDP3405057.1 hypothetical protein [Brevundimonas sp.]
MNSPRLMTKSEFARHRGVGKSAVSNWAKAQLLVMAEDQADQSMKIDVVRTEARLNAKIDPARGRPTKAAAEPQGDLPLTQAGTVPVARGESLADVRTDLIRAQTVKAQLDNARRAGELVPLEEYVRRAAEYGRVSRERMMSIVRTQSEWLAAAKDPRTIVARLEEEIDRAYADLAAQIETGVVDVEDGEAREDAADLAEVESALADGDDDDAVEAVG